ncbi:GIY-YIG nuclease family protein [Leifsonia sp. fls2-241-R2A-40a]|uniref:GIY-YIG nuclease family protein n=1 Tax=Leifsonia sp. fls2-241-R2A-40a TaxID=3040290 RepID=UPI00254FB6DC|nr:GIY-YIG nuclease family protein [Leifsonia sp. fls2-241-R2A-40a]
MPTPTEPAVVDHFGERIRRGKYGFRLTRDTYAIVNKKPSVYFSREEMSPAQWEALSSIYEHEDHRILSDEFCARNRAQALENFDLNMASFAQIAQADFEAALSTMLERNRSLKPVSDLRKWDGAQGLYVMVLDEYQQCYIGQSTDIRRRLKAHWAGTKQFDRLLWGGVHESVISIDAFRALDTTRIFAARTVNADQLETRIVSKYPADLLLNRINGGLMTGFRAMFIAGEVKRRQLTVSG